MTYRPYFNSGIDELEWIYSQLDELDSFKMLQAELKLRTTPRATTLLRKVDRAIRDRELSEPSITIVSDSDETPTETGSQIQFSRSQQELIERSPSSRLIVNAGPGTGKTEVACARVAFLIAERDISPHQILMISFTRTAVKEIRDRLVKTIGAKAEWVRIATLDSHAFQLVQGFASSDEEKRFLSYDSTIENALELVQSGSSDVLDFLGEMEHLVVDEAQDVVGPRAQLVVALIRAMSPTAGVTVLTDDAQAIYGFSLEDNEGSPEVETITLPRIIRKEISLAFEEVHLTEIYRTASSSLLKIFTDTRKLVLDDTLPDAKKLARVRGEIERYADGKTGELDVRRLRGQNDCLVLFRRRVEVLTASSFLSSENIPHRIRMPGTPANVYAWFAILFWDFEERRISQSEFTKLWERLAKFPCALENAASWWELLVRHAGQSADVVDVHDLRRILSRSRPPIAFVAPEAGQSGPMLGTIHSSKGREALHVELRVPAGSSDGGDLSEEARVLFVGATRARKTLKVGKGYWLQASRLKNGSQRVFRKLSDGGLMIEFGCERDLDLAGQAGRSLFGSDKSLQDSQTRLQEMIWKVTKVRGTKTTLQSEDGKEYLYRLITEEDNTVIGHFCSKVGNDIFAIGDQLHLGSFKPPDEIRNLYVIDVRTLALAPDDPVVSSLRPPFNRSGMMLSPLVFSFPKIFVQRYRRRFLRGDPE